MAPPPRYSAARLLPLLLLLLCGELRAQPAPRVRGTGIAFYDTGGLYDTLPSPFYDDTDHTPRGRLRWTSERYFRRIAQVAALADSLALPLIALWGVENEAVVRDIAAACRSDYTYLHETLNSLDGMDFALLYHGDRFIPLRTMPGRRCLGVEGLLGRDSVLLLLSADSRTARWMTSELREEHPRHRLLVLGNTEEIDPGSVGLRDALARAARAGRGSEYRRGRWRMRCRILVDTAMRARHGDVYARRFLLHPATGLPEGVYVSGRYAGGCGKSLPVFTYVE